MFAMAQFYYEPFIHTGNGFDECKEKVQTCIRLDNNGLGIIVHV